MQKKLIALALASLAGSAFAQSNVTIYGVADGTLEFAKATGATSYATGYSAATGTFTTFNGSLGNTASQTRLASNSSLLGFKGVEDLGNGLKAVFQLEAGIDFTGNNDGSGTSGLFNGQVRDSFVGLTGGFGTAVAGTLTHPIRAMGAKVDFNPGASSVGFTGSMYGEFLGVKTGTDERAKNAVAYVSPSFSGFTVTGAYVSGGVSPANDARLDAQNGDQNAAGSFHSQQWQVAAQYENGPLYAGLGYHHAKDPRAFGAVAAAATPALRSAVVGEFAAAGVSITPAVSAAAVAAVGGLSYNDKLTDWRLAGKYTFGSGTSVSALYDVQKYTVDAFGLDSATAKRKAWMIGANQNFGKNNVYLQYAKAQKPTGDLLEGAQTNQMSATQWTLGYSYDLSKRTLVHAYYSVLSNKDLVAYDNYVNGINGGNVGTKNTAFGAGLRHSF